MDVETSIKNIKNNMDSYFDPEIPWHRGGSGSRETYL